VHGSAQTDQKKGPHHPALEREVSEVKKGGGPFIKGKQIFGPTQEGGETLRESVLIQAQKSKGTFHDICFGQSKGQSGVGKGEGEVMEAAQVKKTPKAFKDERSF